MQICRDVVEPGPAAFVARMSSCEIRERCPGLRERNPGYATAPTSHAGRIFLTADLFHHPRPVLLDGAMHGIRGKVEVTRPGDYAALDPGLREQPCISQRRENAGGSRMDEI
jgi:hypothetical protein